MQSQKVFSVIPRRSLSPYLPKETTESLKAIDQFAKTKHLGTPTSNKFPFVRTNSDHTYLSADGIRVSFITAK